MIIFFFIVAPFASPNRQYLPPQQQSGQQPSTNYGAPQQGGPSVSSQYGAPNQGSGGFGGGNQGGFGGGSGGFGQQPSQSYGAPSQGKS